MADEVPNIPSAPSAEVVHSEDLTSPLDQPVRKMATQETRHPVINTRCRLHGMPPRRPRSGPGLTGLQCPAAPPESHRDTRPRPAR